MPTYDYVCRACEHRFEHFQSMQEAPLRKCPECGKPRLQRLIGAGAGILFKGSGFYETDYKRKSPPSTEGAKPGGTDGQGCEARRREIRRREVRRREVRRAEVRGGLEARRHAARGVEG
jgi:putative FmdB family regulatory protein